MADVSHEIALQVGNGSEHAAGDDVALDLREPQLDPVEPGRVRRGEMQVNLRMRRQEFLNQVGLVGRVVIRDHVDHFAARLVDHQVGEKGDELSRGVPGRRLAQYFGGFRVERGIQRQRAVALILEAVGASRREWQHRVEPVEGLNGRLLAHAENRRVLRRVQVETDDVGGFGLEVRIV